MDLVFSKDMAYYVSKKFNIFLKEDFKDFQHTFIIRDPRAAVPSQYRAATNPNLKAWDFFEAEDAGFKAMFELFVFVQENLGASPVVVDAEDLLHNPEGMMKSYCGAVGVTYQANMTKWSPGPVADFDPIWPGWHENILKSSGITRQQTPVVNWRNMPEEVERIVRRCMPYYEAMHESRIYAQVMEDV